MGLDMYLLAEKFVNGYDFSEPQEKEQFNQVVNSLEANDFISESSPMGTVQLNVGYWRKVNAIHKWFVDNCQNGLDECQKSYVSRQDLITLLDVCKEVLKDKTKADELLPTGAGFFFGDTDYDDWYFKGLEHTVEMITKLLKNVPEGWDFYYQSSW